MNTIFFCGHKSSFGKNFINSLIKSELNIKMIILATDDRWKYFRKKLSGNNNIPNNDLFHHISIIINSIIRKLKKIIIKNTQENDIEIIARQNNISIKKIYDVNSREFIEEIKNIGPDLIICSAYPQIFSKELINIPNKGSVNFHPSLLPKYRGAHPHFWTILHGEKVSGITAHFMTENIDGGDIISQIEFDVDNLTYHQLYKKIIEHIPSIIDLTVNNLLSDNPTIKKQDNTKATYFKNDRAIHHRIFWTLHNSQYISNLIRTEKAFCFFRHKKILITKAHISKSNRNLTNNVKAENGTIIDINTKYLAVALTNGCLNIRSMIIDNKNLSYDKFASKYNVQIGEKFD